MATRMPDIMTTFQAKTGRRDKEEKGSKEYMPATLHQ
jgi:hypothetical protein